METTILCAVQSLGFEYAGAYLARIVENETKNMMDDEMEAAL